MIDKVTEYLKQYEPEWLKKFLFAAFGKYRYVHTLSSTGLDCYLSNIRNVDQSHPDDAGSVNFYVGHDLFNVVDYKDQKLFLEIFKRYLNLKAFI